MTHSFPARRSSDLSVITRSTASCICSLICAMLSSGTAGSPRRSSATSLCELRMACSPPFTATYMASVLRQDAARQADDGLAAGQEDVDPARELRGVESPVVPEPLGKPKGSDDRGVDRKSTRLNSSH